MLGVWAVIAAILDRGGLGVFTHLPAIYGRGWMRTMKDAMGPSSPCLRSLGSGFAPVNEIDMLCRCFALAFLCHCPSLLVVGVCSSLNVVRFEYVVVGSSMREFVGCS